MKFLVDSCVSKFAVESLRNENHNVVWIPEENNDPGDDVILERAYNEQRTLITADKDFGNLVFVFQKPHPAIIRIVNVRAKLQGEILLKIVEKYKKEFKKKPLITVDESRVRIKYP